ncbi:uncharacterized protein LOC109728026 isoform X2 [Ananas comosus]|nr:uncharacterized protein LOC109728026 isoform X2 [Ananas comosus]
MGTIKENDDSAPADVIKVIGEPAIVINGVPDVNPNYETSVRVNTENNRKSESDPFLGEWLEGRQVRKLFGDRYYSGKVVEYDDEMNWYRIVYEDGDLEDLEWRELEEVLVPLDISIPLKTLALQRCKHEKSPPSTSGGNVRKCHNKSRESKGKSPKLLQQAETNDIMSNQLLILKKEPNSQEALKGKNENTKGSKEAFHNTDDSNSTKRQREIQRQSSRTAHAEKQKRRER